MPPFTNPINPNIALRIALQGVLVMRVMRDEDREDRDMQGDRDGDKDRVMGGQWREWEELEGEGPRLYWERCVMRRHPCRSL